ncbi:MAG: hypothetical protein RLZZ362_511 [Actinomycetota bacterium]
MAVSLPFVVAAIVLQYVVPLLAAAMLLVFPYLWFVVVPKWARADLKEAAEGLPH